MQKNHYEVHITVLLSHESELARFQHVCTSCGVKPIIIDLYAHTRKTQRDVMTSSQFYVTEEEVFGYAYCLYRALTTLGFAVCRIKIESDPFHPTAPQTLRDSMPTNCYFESHIPVQVFTGRESELSNIMSRTDARISRNPFKSGDGYAVSMVTLRDYVSPFCVFQGKLTETLSLIHDHQFNLIIDKKLEVEFAVYDSNWQHDHAWILGK